jgi:hypothetical protein
MIRDLSPLYHNGVALIRPEDAQAKKGSWVRFSNKWPGDPNKGGWAKGGTFIVSQEPVLVDYPVSVNVVNQDYATLDLTNQTNPTLPGVPHPTAAQKGTLQMYPVNPSILYQISVGMKDGHYFIQTQIPSGTTPLYQLGSSAIPPSITDPVYRYLGAKYPKDSPYDSPTWFLHTIMNAPQIVLLVFMDGGEEEAAGVFYGKATIDFRVNKCQLTEISLESISSLHIPYGSNAVFSVQSGQVAVVTGSANGNTILTAPTKSTVPLAAGEVTVAPSGWTVSTGASGSALVTTMEDVRQWRSIRDKALYIPYYDELTGF